MSDWEWRIKATAAVAVGSLVLHCAWRRGECPEGSSWVIDGPIDGCRPDDWPENWSSPWRMRECLEYAHVVVECDPEVCIYPAPCADWEAR